MNQGLILCEGTGRKSDPLRYWTAEREGVWKQNPLYELLEPQIRKYPFVSLTQKRRGDKMETTVGDDE